MCHVPSDGRNSASAEHPFPTKSVFAVAARGLAAVTVNVTGMSRNIKTSWLNDVPRTVPEYAPGASPAADATILNADEPALEDVPVGVTSCIHDVLVVACHGSRTMLG